MANADGSVGLGGYNVHDLLFAGKFRPLLSPDGNNGGSVGAGAGGVDPLELRFFDQLAAFGFSAELGSFRWIIDTNSNGVVNLPTDILTLQPTLGNFNVAGALPVAGNFDNNAANGDEIGLYNAGRWALDTNHNFVIDAADTIITNNLFGHPIVGDFDGDGFDDLAVFNNNLFSFNLANDTLTDAADATMIWGYPGRARSTGGRRHGPGRHRRHRPLGAAHDAPACRAESRSGISSCRTISRPTDCRRFTRQGRLPG